MDDASYTRTYPTKEEVINYLTEYERRYEFNVRRPVEVKSVEKSGSHYLVSTNEETYSSKVVVCSSGNWSNPFIPSYPGRDKFLGMQIHSANYEGPEKFQGKKVLIVGGGNSAAQILAEVSLVAETFWITKEPPEYLPDDVDGRYLFDLATKKYQAMLKGETLSEAYNLAKIVMVDSVKEARARGVLNARDPFDHLTETSAYWSDGAFEKIDAIIWCTGFRPALKFLEPLNVFTSDGYIETDGPKSLKYPGLYFVGYGDWAGFAAATLIGVQRWAKLTSQQISDFIKL